MHQRAAARLSEISSLSARDFRLIALYKKGTSMDPDPDKVAALTDAARALAEAGIAYALIGGVAVGIHSGTPRATIDVDLAAIGSDRRSVVDALERAGFRKTGEFTHSVNFRHASGEPVQISFDAGFDQMIERAESFDVGGVAVRIVRKDDLIVMKERAANDPTRRRSKRLRDQADLELLRGDVGDPDEGW